MTTSDHYDPVGDFLADMDKRHRQNNARLPLFFAAGFCLLLPVDMATGHWGVVAIKVGISLVLVALWLVLRRRAK